VRSDGETVKNATEPNGAVDATTLVSESSIELRPGDILRERFVIERLLGEGGMGKVFLAVDREAEQSNPHVALKVLSERFKAHPQSLKALRREASQSQRMNHPNVVNVFFFERTQEHVFMVMEFMQGDSLDVHISQHPQGNKLDTVWPIIEGCAQGLIYIHSQKIIHSDFKPSNVFITEQGEIKVLDLGIARSLEENNVVEGTTRFNPDALGALTPSYASIEMFEGLTPTAQDDLYALGCVIYELLTGQHPYQRKTALEARAEMLEPERPRGLKSRQWRALKAALAFSRGERPTDVGAFLEEFAPEKATSRKVPWLAAITSIIATTTLVSGLAIWQLDNSDDRFLQATFDRFPAGKDLVSTERAQDWLEQGKFFHMLGLESLDGAEYDRAVSQLISAPSSAWQSYRLVLLRNDDTQTRDQAARGMLEISRAFRDKAMMLAENNGDTSDIAKNVCNGLDVNQFDSELLDLFDQLSRQAPNRVEDTPACRRLVSDGKVSS
jgi:serine/threonine protein kinase